MKILYLGPVHDASTSRHRALALMRLGHQVTHLDAGVAIPGNAHRWGAAFHYKTGYRFGQQFIDRWLGDALRGKGDFDVCWVDGGEHLGADALHRLHRHADKVVLFNHDDPSGPRDADRFATLRKAIPLYDLCVVVRPFNVDEFKALGACDVLHVYRSYDEVAHRPWPDAHALPQGFRNDVVFLGRNMTGEGRDLVIRDLVRSGLRVAVWGDNWQQSSVWADIGGCWRGHSLAGRDYVAAIQGAQLSLGFLSKGNRDEHTTRTLEIPFAGGLLCAQRTPEHLQMYRDGIEALFWDSSEECVQVCQRALADTVYRNAICRQGRQRVLALRVGNEDLCGQVIERLAAAARPLGVRHG